MTPENKTIWDVLEESLIKHANIPAIEYYKKGISRKEFINNVYTWARALRGMGICENDVVPIYGTAFIDICAITCALNMIGATPYFYGFEI